MYSKYTRLLIPEQLSTYSDCITDLTAELPLYVRLSKPKTVVFFQWQIVLFNTKQIKERESEQIN